MDKVAYLYGVKSQPIPSVAEIAIINRSPISKLPKPSSFENAAPLYTPSLEIPQMIPQRLPDIYAKSNIPGLRAAESSYNQYMNLRTSKNEGLNLDSLINQELAKKAMNLYNKEVTQTIERQNKFLKIATSTGSATASANDEGTQNAIDEIRRATATETGAPLSLDRATPAAGGDPLASTVEEQYNAMTNPADIPKKNENNLDIAANEQQLLTEKAAVTASLRDEENRQQSAREMATYGRQIAESGGIEGYDPLIETLYGRSVGAPAPASRAAPAPAPTVAERFEDKKAKDEKEDEPSPSPPVDVKTEFEKRTSLRGKAGEEIKKSYGEEATQMATDFYNEAQAKALAKGKKFKWPDTATFNRKKNAFIKELSEKAAQKIMTP